MAYWLAWEEPRAVGDLVHVEKFFARNLGGLTRARTCAGPAREGNSRTPSMHVDEKCGGRGGKGLTQGKQPTAGPGSDTEPSCHVDPIGGCAPDRMRFSNRARRRSTRGWSPVR